MLTQLDTFMGSLDENKPEIVEPSTPSTGSRPSAHQAVIDTALDELPSALRGSDHQPDDLVKMLRARDALSPVAIRVIQACKQSHSGAVAPLPPDPDPALERR